MKTVIVLLTILFCLGMSYSATAQKSNSPSRTTKTSTNVRIIRSKPHISISYEREGKIDPLYVGESDRRVWLRFHNNSRWQVMFCSSPVSKEYGETEIEYEIERYRGYGETPGTRTSDVCGYLLLDSGKSIIFSIPREHLAEGLAIKVQFRYEWETESDGSTSDLEPKHFAYFFSEDISESPTAVTSDAKPASNEKGRK